MKHDSKDNRKPQAKSGRARKKNALLHGVYSKDVVLRFESSEDFEALLADLRAELVPDGCLEEEVVFDLARVRWLKRRALKMWSAEADNDPFLGPLIRSGKKSWPGIRKVLRNEGRSFRNATEAIGDLAANVTAVAKKLAGDLMNSRIDEPEINKAEKRLEELTSLVNKRMLPLIRALEQGPSADRTLRRMHSPEYMERNLRVERDLDARETSLLSKLVRLQEYKRLRRAYQKGPSSIEGGRSLLELRRDDSRDINLDN
jgi:hypothetical protein